MSKTTALLTFENDYHRLIFLKADKTMAKIESENGIKAEIPGDGFNSILALCDFLKDQPVLKDKYFVYLINFYITEEMDSVFPGINAVPVSLFFEDDIIKLEFEFEESKKADLEALLSEISEPYRFSYTVGI